MYYIPTLYNILCRLFDIRITAAGQIEQLERRKNETKKRKSQRMMKIRCDFGFIAFRKIRRVLHRNLKYYLSSFKKITSYFSLFSKSKMLF